MQIYTQKFSIFICICRFLNIKDICGKWENTIFLLNHCHMGTSVALSFSVHRVHVINGIIPSCTKVNLQGPRMCVCMHLSAHRCSFFCYFKVKQHTPSFALLWRTNDQYMSVSIHMQPTSTESEFLLTKITQHCKLLHQKTGNDTVW